MKRGLFLLWTVGSVLLAVLFVLTAGPARLYAESQSYVPRQCVEPEFEACTGKAEGQSCSYEGGVPATTIPSSCIPGAQCVDTDGGLARPLECTALGGPLCSIVDYAGCASSTAAGTPCVVPGRGTGSCQPSQCYDSADGSIFVITQAQVCAGPFGTGGPEAGEAGLEGGADLDSSPASRTTPA